MFNINKWAIMGLVDIEAWARGAARNIAAAICKFIYELIAKIYNVLLTVGRVRLLNSSTCKNTVTGEIIKIESAITSTFTGEEALCTAAGGKLIPSPITLIYQRITLLIAIIMTFYIAFQLVQYLLNPDDVVDKEKGAEKLGFRLLTVVVLLGIVPNIFDLAYTVQDRVLESQLLSKLVLGTEVKRTDLFGNNFSKDIFSKFYYAEYGLEDEWCVGMTCKDYIDLVYQQITSTGSFDWISYGLTEEKNNRYIIHFDPLFAIAVGVGVLWILVMYAIDVGTRVIQLTFLQVIAPIPIISYLSPKKEGTFQKWAKQCVITYIDLFIRLGVIYFTVLLITAVTDAFNNGTLLSGIDGNTSILIYLVLVLGLMMFCKRLPKLIQELFPSLGAASGEFGLKPGSRLPTKQIKSLARTTGRVAGAGVVGAAGLLYGAASGFRQGLRAGKRNGAAGFGRAMQGMFKGGAGGLARGVYNGGKKGSVIKNAKTAFKNQTAANKSFGNRAESGYRWRDQIRDTLTNAFGLPGRKEIQEKVKKPMEQLSKERTSQREYRSKLNDKTFDKAMNGKGGEKVRNAVGKYTELDNRLKDLSASDSVERQQYRKGKVKQNAASIKGYNVAVTEKNAALSNIDSKVAEETSRQIDKNDYRMKQNVYDEEAHKKARQDPKYRKLVKDERGHNRLVFDEKAWENDKNKYTKEVEVFDEAKYNSAFENLKSKIREEKIAEIEKKFNDDTKNYVYQTDDEAEQDRAIKMDALKKQVDDAKKQVSFAYEDWALQEGKNGGHNDEEIFTLQHNRLDEERLYNDYNKDYAIERGKEINEVRQKLLAKKKEEYAAENNVDISDVSDEMIEISKAEVENEWTKTTVSNSIRDAQDIIREADAKIAQIDYETQGSGIAGNK